MERGEELLRFQCLAINGFIESLGHENIFIVNNVCVCVCVFTWCCRWSEWMKSERPDPEHTAA